jgi:hypothetical protein
VGLVGSEVSIVSFISAMEIYGSDTFNTIAVEKISDSDYNGEEEANPSTSYKSSSMNSTSSLISAASATQDIRNFASAE